MIATIPENGLEDKVCQHLSLGLLHEVLPVTQIEDLLETYQMWEQREKKLNMVAMVYWLIGLHLYPHLSQRAVYAKLVSGQRTTRDDVAESIPVKSAFSYRREQLGSEFLEELFATVAGPQATPETPGAFLICDAEISSCRQGETSSMRVLLERWQWENCLLLWESGFHASWAIFVLRAHQCHVVGRLKSNVLLSPVYRLCDGSYLTYIYEDQDHHSGCRMLVRVISYTFTDSRIPGAGQQVYRLVTTLLDPFLSPAKDVAVLSHDRWQVELVIDENDTHLRLSARTLRSQTPNGVIQELYALLVAHALLRQLMLRTANQYALAPTTLSFTATLRLVDDSQIPLSLVNADRRTRMVDSLLQELATCRVPKQRLRIQARVVKRVRSRYERKKPEHCHAPPFELDLDFHQIIAVVV